MAKTPPLVIESFEDETNLVFLTLIEHKKVRYLTIIENVVEDEIHAYVLDQLEAEGIDQSWFLSVAIRWFYSSSHKYPLSFEFAKHGHGDIVKRVLKTFAINSTSRIIGKLFTYKVNTRPKVKRRKLVPLTEYFEVKLKKD